MNERSKEFFTNQISIKNFFSSEIKLINEELHSINKQGEKTIKKQMLESYLDKIEKLVQNRTSYDFSLRMAVHGLPDEGIYTELINSVLNKPDSVERFGNLLRKGTKKPEFNQLFLVQKGNNSPLIQIEIRNILHFVYINE